ncbi:signal peptide peptidase SppA [Spirulina subsalsa]|uniref:signal peptide peptidase SppA n=1 Tax=Spirulina subsalsa TaxID=54311 RepID=UPI0002D7F12E|nr:signal peptide peptidase SppA [Spirulina subsalsa]
MLRFFQQVIASLIGTLAALLILSTMGLGLFTLLIVAALSQEESPRLRNQSMLVFDLSLEIRDTEPILRFSESFGSGSPRAIALRRVLQNLEKAAQDDRIVGLLLDGSNGNPTAGYATLKEVRAALETFQESGKTIIAYDVNMGKKGYYLASLADRLILNPMGVLELNGLSSEQFFLAGALDQLGIGVQVVRVGDYKSAVEPLIQEEFSPENRQQISQLLQEIWGEYLAVVSGGRELNVSQVETAVNEQGILLPEAALAANLIDEVAHYDEVMGEIKELTGQDSKTRNFRQVSLSHYTTITVEAAARQPSQNKVAVVYAEGPIIYGRGGERQISSDRLVRQLRTIRHSDEVKAVVLRVNSPGGSATASDIILRELQLLAEEKPVVVSMGDVAASGGYWIATGADYIFAQPNTITGSIGVFGVIPNVAEISNNNGITWDGVKTSPFADIESISRPKNEAELALLQNFVNQIYDLFLEKVANSRDLSPSAVAEVAQGRIWSGIAAQNLGLVDELGGLENAIAHAAEKAELGDDWEAEEYIEEPRLEDILFRRLVMIFQAETQPQDPITKELSRLHGELSVLHQLNDPRDIYSHLLFDLRIR